MKSVAYRTGNLFELAVNKPKVHCVSADLAMGAGIAKEFRERYGKPALPDGCTRLYAGVCLMQLPNVPQDRAPIFHLVTKLRYQMKPTEDSLGTALQALRKLLEDVGLKEVWMPKIACGLDRMDWDTQVRPLVERVFVGWNGQVVVVMQ